jgi:hypothetical protein
VRFHKRNLKQFLDRKIMGVLFKIARNKNTIYRLPLQKTQKT